MKSVLAISTLMLAGLCLSDSATAADQPGKLSIYAQTWDPLHGFEPRSLTERERELIHQIVAAGGEFQALYIPDVVIGKVDTLDQVAAKFGHFSVRCDSPAISRAVRPLCDELQLPLGLSLKTSGATGRDQIAAWQGCRQIRRLMLMHPHMNPDDLLGLGDYPALETLQLGWRSLRLGTGLSGFGPDAPALVTITNDVVDALSRIGTLRRISLHRCPVTATNLNRLQHLQSLWIQDTELTSETLASCGRLAQLEELDLTGSVLTKEQVTDWSGLQNVRTLGLPDSSPQLQQTLRLHSGLDKLRQLEGLFFSRLRGDDWPDLSGIPERVQRVELYDVMLDGLSDLGFYDARLQAHRVLYQREPDAGRFVLTEMQDSRDAQRRGCRIAGRQVESIIVRGQEYEPTDFRIVRFPHWTVEAGFAHDASTSAPDYPDFTPPQRQAAQRLARLDLPVHQEFPGGGFIVGDLADVYLRWDQPLALPDDAADVVDQLVRIPLQKLVITTDEFPLERLAELEKITTLTSFELKREGLTDVHLVVLQSWNHLEELTIHSPGNKFSKEGLELLAKSLPKCDLQITAEPGQPPLLLRKKPPAGAKTPPIEF